MILEIKEIIKQDAEEYAASAVQHMQSDRCIFNKENLYKLVKEIYVQVAEYSVENYKQL